MEITKNHLLNLGIWVFILLFMSIKSMDHTLQIYQQSVDSNYQKLSKAFSKRNEYLQVILYQPGMKNLEETRLRRLVITQKNESNSQKKLLANIAVSDYLNEKFQRIVLTKQERKRLVSYRNPIENALFSYNVHADAYNQTLDALPYKIYGSIRGVLFDWPYQPVNVIHFEESKGLIVDR